MCSHFICWDGLSRDVIVWFGELENGAHCKLRRAHVTARIRLRTTKYYAPSPEHALRKIDSRAKVESTSEHRNQGAPETCCIATHSGSAASALSVLMSVALKSWNWAPLNPTSDTRHLKLQYPNTSPSPSGAGCTEWWQQQYQKWQARKNVVLHLGSTIAMTHWNVRCLQRSRFVK